MQAHVEKDTAHWLALDRLGALEGMLALTQDFAVKCVGRVQWLEQKGAEVLDQSERADPLGWARGKYDWINQGVDAFEVGPLSASISINPQRL